VLHITQTSTRTCFREADVLVWLAISQVLADRATSHNLLVRCEFPGAQPYLSGTAQSMQLLLLLHDHGALLDDKNPRDPD
jgi:hypothetical protein